MENLLIQSVGDYVIFNKRFLKGSDEWSHEYAVVRYNGSLVGFAETTQVG